MRKGSHHTIEARRLMSLAERHGSRRKCSFDCTCGRHNLRGQPQSEEVKRKKSLTLKGRTHSDEMRRKVSLSMGGNGTLEVLCYPREFNQALKEEVKCRDGYTCQLCSKQITLQVHHIDYNKWNNSIKNLVTLCKNCNLKVNFKRDWWVVYFTHVRV